jgi:hypothetical protein
MGETVLVVMGEILTAKKQYQKFEKQIFPEN